MSERIRCSTPQKEQNAASLEEMPRRDNSKCVDPSLVMLAEEVMPASARVAATEALAAATKALTTTTAKAFLCMAAAKGMESTTLVRRLHGRPGEAIPPKTCRGRTLREIVTLEASRCRGTIGWLRNTVGCTRPAARETGAIPRTPELLRIDRRLHVV